MKKKFLNPILYLFGIPVLAIFLVSGTGIRNNVLTPVPTTLNDFFLPGSQPMESGTFKSVSNCNCHEGTVDEPGLPSFNWQGSMMAQAARDPLYLACLAISNQDAPEVGDLCIRCHAPVGWLEGRSEPTNGSALTADDKEGVQCHFCHKLVKPTPTGVNPYPGDPLYTTAPANNKPSTYEIDQTYLSGMSSVIPDHSANGMYIVEDDDKNRRGPFFDSDAKHDNPYSPFHPESELCGTCHDVSNPVFSAVKDGSGNILEYIPNDFDAAAPDFSPYEMFPVERTYSEWKMSAYNTAQGVYSAHFGGNKEYVSSCQDCHMKDVSGYGASNSQIYRENLPHHDMTGGNTFMTDVLKTLFPVYTNELNAAKYRALYMLQHAATVNLSVAGNEVDVEVVNETGHKLPSGYPEGRRIWINLVAYDMETQEVYESGKYNFETAELEKEGTKIYEIKPGIGSNIASVVNLPEGPSFHFVLNNEIFSDNRIPPRGFTNANFEAIQSPPVNYSYADGQHWDNTVYTLPFEPEYVEVKLYYQTTSKEYVEFLRDENTTNDAGTTLYDLWAQHGKSAPEIMNQVSWNADPSVSMLKWTGDVDSDWNNPGNWDQNDVPDGTKDVMIPGGIATYPQLSGTSNTCHFLLLESGSQISVLPGANLSVNGAMILRDGRYGIPSLLEYGNVSVSGFVESNFQLDEDRWHYFSTPLANQTANSFYDLYLYSYDPLTGNWINITDETTPLVDGMGYKVWSYSTDSGIKNVRFRGPGGDLHSGDFNLPVFYSEINDNYSFVGNPYLSAVDWDHPGWTKTGIGAAVYVWDGVQYLSWNGSAGALTGGIIPAMQGFFVSDDGTTPTPELIVTNDARTHGLDPYKMEAQEYPVFHIHVDGNGYYDNTYICFNSEATEFFDPDFDAFKIMGNEQAPQIFSRYKNEQYSINVLPDQFHQYSIPVDFMVPAAEDYKFTFSGVTDISYTGEIELIDHKEKLTLDLSQISSYSFSADPMDAPERFTVVFKASVHPELQNSGLLIRTYGNTLWIMDQDGLALPEYADIYTSAGQHVFSASLKPTSVNVLKTTVGPGVYVVRVRTGSGFHSEKVYLR